MLNKFLKALGYVLIGLSNLFKILGSIPCVFAGFASFTFLFIPVLIVSFCMAPPNCSAAVSALPNLDESRSWCVDWGLKYVILPGGVGVGLLMVSALFGIPATYIFRRMYRLDPSYENKVLVADLEQSWGMQKTFLTHNEMNLLSGLPQSFDSAYPKGWNGGVDYCRLVNRSG